MAKKAIKKAAKKVVKKAAKKVEVFTEEKRIPLSRFVCQMLVNKVPDAEIVEAMKEGYSDKDCTQKTISWYRYAINSGRMEKVGFRTPKDKLINPKRSEAAARKILKDGEALKKPAAKKAVKKAVKKVSRRK